MKKTRTLILGGGFGGLSAAHTLRKLLPPEHAMTLIDRTSTFHVGAAKTWVMLGERTPDEATSERRGLVPKGVDLLEADIQAIHAERGEIVTSEGTMQGDFLVIALGADVTMAPMPGLAEAASTFYTLDDAVQLRDRVKVFEGGTIVFLIPRTPFKCPPAPYEAALLLHELLDRRGLRARTQISIHTVEPAPMPTAGPEMGAFIRDLLAERDIAYHPQKQTTRVDPAHRRIVFADGSEAEFDLLIAIPPHVAPQVVRDAHLTDLSGWIPVDAQTLKVKGIEGPVPVYAIGDIAAVPLPGRFKPDVPLMLPKAGVFAASQGVIAAKHIASAVLAKPVPDVFDGKGFCYIETGKELAVKGEGAFFELPHPKMSRQAPDNRQFRDKQEWVNLWLKGAFEELLS